MSIDNDPMAEIRASFFVESEELLEALQDSLQLMDDGADDAETINVVFRAVHSIKGGAGAFGLEALVHFAHRYETVLDEVRAGRLEVKADALKVFFQAADHLSDLVRISRDDAPLPETETEALIEALDVFLGDEARASVAQDTAGDAIEFQPMGLALDLDLSGGADTPDLPDLDNLPLPDFSEPAEDNSYVITFTPLPELFDTGNEPALLLRNLQLLGDTTITCDTSGLPTLGDLRPDIPHLSWTIALHSDVQEGEIASIFEFVDGLCKLDIRPSGAAERPQLPDLPELDPVKDLPPMAPLPAPPLAPPSPETSPPLAPADKATKTAEPAPDQTTLERPAGAAPQTAPAKSVVRVDLDRIERLVNLVGELVINQAMLSQSLEHSGLSPHSDAMNGLEEFQRLTRDIQDSVMMIRAQPVKSLFQRMSRIVREASAAVGKDVRLVTTGESTEVDKTVIERLADPLTHMIRNAVDHGLESKETRIAAGKPPQGRVNLSAAHRSGRVVIEISDDGAGINRPKVMQIAIEKGLIPADSSLSDTEIDNLLFLPGFSTASTISNLSGRGVGMDVVRTAIQALGGRITTTSQPGQGTAFSISLPLTLAVLDGMVIEVAQETLVLPLNLVIETLTLQRGDVEMVRPGRHVVRVRSGFVPLFDLGAALGYRPPLSDFDGSVVLLIANEDETHAALLIDNILDQRQVVIKGLDESFYRAPGIAAATILGDGQIALILDPSDIISTTLPKSGMPHPGQEAGIPA
ncbi:MAG: two-component system chemotaxis sensor kinase CheA [Sulfitobacter sp.]|jgi:two-component system chemotaxis sensor kinase CheA